MVSKPEPPDPHYGTYERGGETRVAPSLDHAVKLEFDGYSKVGDATAEGGGTATPAVASAAKAAPKTGA